MQIDWKTGKLLGKSRGYQSQPFPLWRTFWQAKEYEQASTLRVSTTLTPELRTKISDLPQIVIGPSAISTKVNPGLSIVKPEGSPLSGSMSDKVAEVKARIMRYPAYTSVDLEIMIDNLYHKGYYDGDY